MTKVEAREILLSLPPDKAFFWPDIDYTGCRIWCSIDPDAPNSLRLRFRTVSGQQMEKWERDGFLVSRRINLWGASMRIFQLPGAPAPSPTQSEER